MTKRTLKLEIKPFKDKSGQICVRVTEDKEDLGATYCHTILNFDPAELAVPHSLTSRFELMDEDTAVPEGGYTSSVRNENGFIQPIPLEIIKAHERSQCDVIYDDLKNDALCDVKAWCRHNKIDYDDFKRHMKETAK